VSGDAEDAIERLQAARELSPEAAQLREQIDDWLAGTDRSYAGSGGP
jgi:hypothetical protein